MEKHQQVYPEAKVEDYGYKNHRLLNIFYKVFSSILVCMIIIMLYLSIVVIFIQSINSSKIVSSFEGFTLEWYKTIFNNRSLRNAIINTFIVSVLATLIATILGTFIAIGLFYSKPKLRQKILLLNNFPLLNADIVTGISLMLVFSLLLPIFPYIFGPVTMIVAHLFFTLPYVILSVLPKLKDMDPNILDASLDLGLKPFQSLIKVILPNIKTGILSGMLLAFTISFDDFVVSYYTSGNGFDNLSIWIYSSIGRKSLTPSVYAFSTIITFGTMFILFIVNLLLNKKRSKDEKR
jgi:ABC-type spermidine/putrescine transport system, permease component II